MPDGKKGFGGGRRKRRGLEVEEEEEEEEEEDGLEGRRDGGFKKRGEGRRYGCDRYRHCHHQIKRRMGRRRRRMGWRRKRREGYKIERGKGGRRHEQSRVVGGG